MGNQADRGGVQELVQKWRENARKAVDESEEQRDGKRAIYCEGKSMAWQLAASQLEAALQGSVASPQDIGRRTPAELAAVLKRFWNTLPEAHRRMSLLAVIDELAGSGASPQVCPHCELPPVLPEVCTPEIHAVIERNIARDWDLYDAGREAGIKLAGSGATTPAPQWTCPNSATSCADPHCVEHRGRYAIPFTR